MKTVRALSEMKIGGMFISEIDRTMPCSLCSLVSIKSGSMVFLVIAGIVVLTLPISSYNRLVVDGYYSREWG